MTGLASAGVGEQAKAHVSVLEEKGTLQRSSFDLLFLFPWLVEAEMTNGKGGGVSADGEIVSPSETRRKGASFPKLAVTSHHKRGSLKQIYSLTVLETRSSKPRHQMTQVPLRALGKSALMANPSSADSRPPWLMTPARWLCSHPLMALSPLSPPPMLLCLALIETHVTEYKAHITPNDHFSGLLTSSLLQRPLLSERSPGHVSIRTTNLLPHPAGRPPKLPSYGETCM